MSNISHLRPELKVKVSVAAVKINIWLPAYNTLWVDFSFFLKEALGDHCLLKVHPIITRSSWSQPIETQRTKKHNSTGLLKEIYK